MTPSAILGRWMQQGGYTTTRELADKIRVDPAMLKRVMDPTCNAAPAISVGYRLFAALSVPAGDREICLSFWFDKYRRGVVD